LGLVCFAVNGAPLVDGNVVVGGKTENNGEVCSPNFPTAATGEICCPVVYTCDGEEINPTITWTHASSNGTVNSFVVMWDDLDFDYFIHWIIADLRSDTRAIPRGESDTVNGTTVRAYIGPCSPFEDRDHVYRITVYAMPTSTTRISIIGKKGDDIDAELRQTARNAYVTYVTNYRNSIRPTPVDCYDQDVPCL